MQLKMTLQPHLLGRSLPPSRLSNQFPKPNTPTPSTLDEIPTDRLDWKVIVLGLIMWLILDLIIQTISLDLPFTQPGHTQACITEKVQPGRSLKDWMGAEKLCRALKTGSILRDFHEISSLLAV